MPRDLLPALERLDRQRGGARHHQSQAGATRRPALLLVLRRGFPRVDQSPVDRRHSHEHGDLAARQPLPHAPRLGLTELAARPHPQRTAQGVHDAVHVVQRQHVKDAIVRAPLPGFDQGPDLRRQVGVRAHRTLRPARGAAGVDDQRASCAVDRRQGLGAKRRRCRRVTAVFELRRCEHTERVRRERRAAVDPRQRCCFFECFGCTLMQLRRHEQRGGPRIGDDLGQLRRRMRRRQRHGHAAGAPDRPLRGNLVEARHLQVAYTRLAQIAVSAKQRNRPPPGGLEQHREVVRAAVRDKRGSLRMTRRPADQRRRSPPVPSASCACFAGKETVFLTVVAMRPSWNRSMKESYCFARCRLRARR